MVLKFQKKISEWGDSNGSHLTEISDIISERIN